MALKYRFQPQARPARLAVVSTQISVSPGGQERHFQNVEALETLLTFTIHLLRWHCGDLNSGIFRNVAPTMKHMEEKEMRVRGISPFLSSKSGSECFLPMSAMDRTKGMRLLSFLSFWWWCFFSMASRTLERRSSSSCPEATMLSITMSVGGGAGGHEQEHR